jgi:hypothetical protein
MRNTANLRLLHTVEVADIFRIFSEHASEDAQPRRRLRARAHGRWAVRYMLEAVETFIEKGARSR